MKLGGKKLTALKLGKLRRGQFISTFGCGAVIDLPKESAIIAGTDFWRHHDNDEYKISEGNLQEYLGVDYFVSPPLSKTAAGADTGDNIPAFRFPNWMYCPTCHRLAPSRTFGFTDHPRCLKCKDKPTLVPSRFVIACENGHLDDFPYEWWVHGSEKCSQPELYISMSEKSSGLESIMIKCKTCGKERSMAGSFGSQFKCTHRRPWLNDKETTSDCKPMRTMQRGATNLHFAITTGALSIPPWSQHIQSELAKKWISLECLMDDKKQFLSVAEKRGLLKSCNCSGEELWQQALIKQGKSQSSGQKSWQDILEEEYKAFLTGSTDEKGQFKTRPAEIPPIVSKSP